jgi:hypothetical protein
MNYFINQKGARNIWVTVTNILRKHLNTKTLNSDSCLKHFSMLFTKVDKGVLLNEGQILGPASIIELDVDFTVQEVKKLILSIKNNRVTGCDGIPAEAWKILASNAEGTEILIKLFTVIRSKREFPKEWQTELIQSIYKGKGSQREPGNYRGISLLPVFGKMY